MDVGNNLTKSYRRGSPFHKGRGVGESNLADRSHTTRYRIRHESRDINFNMENGIVCIDGIRTRIGKRELALLQFFIENQGEVVTRNQILDHVWKGKLVGESSVVVAISNLRRIFKYVDEDCCCLQTISGKGYIFQASKSGFLTSPLDEAIR